MFFFLIDFILLKYAECKGAQYDRPDIELMAITVMKNQKFQKVPIVKNAIYL